MENNLYILDNIILSIESILSKLNCVWRKPSERMNGEITLNSVTISVGHDYSNYKTNELILHPWTMTLEIVLSSDPWVPEYFRPTKQLKILTDYISFHISPDNYNTLKLLWDEYKYLIEYNKNTTKNQNQSMPIIEITISNNLLLLDSERTGVKIISCINQWFLFLL